MRDLNELSGPWSGWSIQDGLRITEAMQLTISNGRISGTGKDKDGEFEMIGAYIDRKQEVSLTRTYTRTTEPSQEGVGIPYEYLGRWDGTFVSGQWYPRMHPSYGGPFEMWPAESDGGLVIQLVEEEEKMLVGTSR